jgi:predicted esterase
VEHWSHAVRWSHVGAVLLVASAAACVLEPPADPSTMGSPEPEAEAADETPPEPAEAPPEPPLVAPPAIPAIASLAIEGFPDAAVALPTVSASARPVVVALHGMGGRPEPQCSAWRDIVGGAAFVLCPRGAYDARRSTPSDRRYTHPGGEPLIAHVEAALRALAARYEGQVDTERPILAGFSLGATEVALLAQRMPDRFPRVAVLEGGLDVWYGPAIVAFATHGGERVLFGCGSAWCTPSAAAAASRLGRGGLEAHVAYAGVGHTLGVPLQTALREELAWFTGGDERWRLAGQD